jgi:thiol:disulfide interchange protein
MSKVNEITSASQLQRLLSANKAVIVDFYATWYVPRSLHSAAIQRSD